jgi:hypothetical protein
LPQMKLKPKNVKVSGLPSPRRLRSTAAKRPNSIRRVLSGWSNSATSPSLIAHRVKETACVAFTSKPTTRVCVTNDDHVALSLRDDRRIDRSRLNLVIPDAGAPTCGPEGRKANKSAPSSTHHVGRPLVRRGLTSSRAADGMRPTLRTRRHQIDHRRACSLPCHLARRN